MLKKISVYSFALVSFLGCEAPPVSTSQPLVTQVNQSEVKRQLIGNCWLYAAASWLESLLKSTDGREVNVSETYWTYWDFYEKLKDGSQLDDEGKFPTGGHWWSVRYLIQTYGWIPQDDFQPWEENQQRASEMQACGERDIVPELQEGGRLYRVDQRSDTVIRQVLDEVFSCQGRYPIDWSYVQGKVQRASATPLQLSGSPRRTTLSEQLSVWQVIAHPGRDSSQLGKGLPSRRSRELTEALGLRVRRALNDKQPVVLSFEVTFEAPDAGGLFNLDTLAERGTLGHRGGHMLVLHDYTVSRAPRYGDLGEGEMSPEEKAAALKGQLETLVAKNSWGRYRWDRPWLGAGYSRFTWDYLTARYFDEKTGVFVPFMESVILPAGY
jgi:hypothetical protein